MQQLALILQASPGASATLSFLLSFFPLPPTSPTPGSLLAYLMPLTHSRSSSTTVPPLPFRSVPFHSSMFSSKSCPGPMHERKKVYRYILHGLLAFLLAVLLTIFIIYLVLRPAKPSFTLQDATLYQFNLTSPNSLTTILQITLYSANSNDRIGIYYGSLSAYASYAYQQITFRTNLPAIYVGTNGVTSWSPFLYGPSVPVGPNVAVELGQDQAVGASVITVQVDGRVRWRVGSWVSGHYHLDVTCQAYVAYVGAWGNAGPNMRLQQPVSCSTNV